jgi:hypothetical protein
VYQQIKKPLKHQSKTEFIICIIASGGTIQIQAPLLSGEITTVNVADLSLLGILSRF